MTSYALTYVLVKGAPISAAEHDANIHNLDDRVTVIETDPPSAVSVASAVRSGDAMIITLTDGTPLDPITLPVIVHPLRGAWAPETNYAKYDWLYANGVSYEALLDHTSAATFDPAANDGAGHDYYAVVMTAPGSSLPPGGAAGQVLAKVDGSDYLVHWVDAAAAALADMTDVAFSTAGPAEGEVLVYRDGVWTSESPRALAAEIIATAETLTAAMDGGYYRCTNAAGCTITVPSDETLTAALDTPIPETFEATFRQAAAGAILLLAESTTAGTVTIHPSQDGHDLMTQYQGATITLKRIGPDEYDMIGPPGALVT